MKSQVLCLHAVHSGLVFGCTQELAYNGDFLNVFFNNIVAVSLL